MSEKITKETTTTTEHGDPKVTVEPGKPAETTTVEETTTESPGVLRETTVKTD